MDKQELYGNMNIQELHKYSVTSKEVIDRDTIWLVYYDVDNDELYRMRVEKFLFIHIIFPYCCLIGGTPNFYVYIYTNGI